MFEGKKAIIFDLDGTLVDSMWIWYDIDKEFLNRRGLELDADLQKSIEGMSFTETANYFKDRYNLCDSIDDIKKEWLSMSHVYYKEKIALKNGVREILEEAKKNNLKLGVGTSNSIELVTTVLETHNIIDNFDTIRTSCEVNKGKPHPDIFLKVAEDLGVKPDECIVFEDTYAGVLAAHRAGMTPIAIYDELSLEYKEEIMDLAHSYINDYHDILARVE